MNNVIGLLSILRFILESGGWEEAVAVALIIILIFFINGLPGILDSFSYLGSFKLRELEKSVKSAVLDEEQKDIIRELISLEYFRKNTGINLTTKKDQNILIKIYKESNGKIKLDQIKRANRFLRFEDQKLDIVVTKTDDFSKSLASFFWWVCIIFSFIFLALLLTLIYSPEIEQELKGKNILYNLVLLFSIYSIGLFCLGIWFLKILRDIDSAQKIQVYLKEDQKKDIVETNNFTDTSLKEQSNKIINGFIYPIFDLMVQLIKHCNLVEYFKKLAIYGFEKYKKTSLSSNEKIQISNITIDLYQLFKFGILFIFWACAVDNSLSKWLIYYLIYSNLFTYFYYHVWGSPYIQTVNRDKSNRRFLNSLLAITYYILCFSYLYQMHYPEMIKWADKVDWINAIYLSVANAFTLTYGGFAPLTQQIRIIFMSELINTFLFFTIIISNSIPNHLGKEQS